MLIRFGRGRGNGEEKRREECAYSISCSRLPPIVRVPRAVHNFSRSSWVRLAYHSVASSFSSPSFVFLRYLVDVG